MSTGGQSICKGKKFTRQDLIEQIHETTGMNHADIKLVLELFMKNIKEALIGGNIVELRGFGTFEVRLRRGKTKARNPRTGEFVDVKPHGTAYWKPGREVKLDVWNLNSADKEKTVATD